MPALRPGRRSLRMGTRASLLLTALALVGTGTSVPVAQAAYLTTSGADCYKIKMNQDKDGKCVPFSPDGVHSTSPGLSGMWQISGQVTCDKPVVGVWVDAGTQSGWAEWHGGKGPLGSLTASFSKKFTAPTTAGLNVGCGRTPQSWAETNKMSGRMLSTNAINYLVHCGGGTCTAVGDAS